MASYAYEHDMQRAPRLRLDPEEARIAQVIELMNQIHVDCKRTLTKRELTIEPERDRTQPPASKLAVSELDVLVFDARDLKRYVEPCPICYCAFELDEEATKMPCKHTYHSNCLHPWLEQHNTCPLCRYELPTIDPVYEELRLQRIGKLKGGNASALRQVPNSYIHDLLNGNATELPKDEESSEEEHPVHQSGPPSGMYA